MIRIFQRFLGLLSIILVYVLPSEALIPVRIPPKVTTALSASQIAQPFGSEDYWNARYRDSNGDFSWYADWNDLEPFVTEFLGGKVLLPGIGNDADLLRNMVAAGYDVSAFDYAPESIAYLQGTEGVDLQVADARTLTCYETDSFDGCFEKGTLDAVYLIGDTEDEKREYLFQAIRELQRVTKGTILSLSGVCTDALLQADWSAWQCLSNGSDVYTTKSGYTSNNLDGALMAWKRL